MTARLKFILLLAIFAGGYASLSMEITAIRQLASFTGVTAVTTSIIIGVFLAFLSLGYWHGSTVSIARYSIKSIVFRAFFIIAFMSLLACSYVLVDFYFWHMRQAGLTSPVLQTFIYALVLLSVAPYCFGLITAVLSRILNRYNHHYTGKIMAVDTVGSVMGSILTTLVFMPFIGVNNTVILLAAVSALAAVPFAKWRELYPLLFVAAFSWFLNSTYFLYHTYNIVEDNALSTIQIVEADEGRSTIMFMNGNPSSKASEDPELQFGYVRYIEDNFLAGLPDDGSPRDILILGAGGFSMGENDETNRYVYVDVDASLKQIAEEYLPGRKLSPNKSFLVREGGQFLATTPQASYDVIVMDTYSSFQNIPQDLLTREYFERARYALKPGGVLLINVIASPGFADRYSQHVDNTLRSIFPYNLSRQIIGPFDSWQGANGQTHNIIYAFHNFPNSGEVYSYDRNAYFYDVQRPAR